MGSVFSPHYARAHGRAPHKAQAHDHVAINLALYGETRAWVFTEAKAAAADVSPNTLRVAGNVWRQTDDGIELTLNDRTTPWGRKVEGRITVRRLGPMGGIIASPGPHTLRVQGGHHWWPVMPLCHIEVDMQSPKLRWVGHGYHDLNYGDEPLAQGFRSWSWMRTTRGGATDILYTAQHRASSGQPATDTTLSLCAHADGSWSTEPVPELHVLQPSGWGLRGVAAAVGSPPAGVRLLEDTPFYRRATWAAGPGADGSVVMHEALDMDRWSQQWVQALLHFRLRRTKP